jgi:3-deoxy-D-manno-octulosonic-acid transferase
MMIVFYNLTIRILAAFTSFALLFHAKAALFVHGRKNIFKRLKADFSNQKKPIVWVHCASLGEFEQGRPVMEAIKNEFPGVGILLTFFSPSGYEVRKNYPVADYVYYLPWDTAPNAKRFIEMVKPSLAIFVKYEFWHHYTLALQTHNIPLLSISAIFRNDQLYFKSFGGFYRKILKRFNYFFVQNTESKKLLTSIDIPHVNVAGDTRFDRVMQIVSNAEEVLLAQKFKAGQKTFVIGSSWPEDIEVLAPFINEQRHGLKFIIAPHEITESSLQTLENSLLVKSIRFSKADSFASLDEYTVLIIDNIGMLSRLYRYGEFAYVGGAFGKGLHNILEAACYGIPVFFGNKNFEKFKEAVDLINRGGAFDVKDYTDLIQKYEMVNVPENFMLACEVTRSYVEENLGATEKIMKYCRTLLNAN